MNGMNPLLNMLLGGMGGQGGGFGGNPLLNMLMGGMNPMMGGRGMNPMNMMNQMGGMNPMNMMNQMGGMPQNNPMMNMFMNQMPRNGGGQMNNMNNVYANVNAKYES